MPHNPVNSAIDHRLMPLHLMLHHGRRKGILTERQGNDPPTRNEKNDPQRRHEWSRFGEDVKSEYIQRNRDNDSKESGDKNQEDNLIRQWLPLLNWRPEAFIEQVLTVTENA